MNMDQWLQQMRTAGPKKAMPILSFPAVTLMGVSVRELIASSELQAAGMQKVAARTPSAAAVSMMDLSVEAEAFGAQVRFSDVEVPTVLGAMVNDEAEAEALAIPPVGAGRTGLLLSAIVEAKAVIQDRPVLAGVIGPFSLAGRLMGVSEAMMNCYEEPEMVHTVLEKTAAFLTAYILAYKAAGADGVVMAEPLAGLLSPGLCEEFSSRYVKRIVEAVQDDAFILIYHNCGNSVLPCAGSIADIGAAAYHFGNAVDMEAMLKAMPAHVPVMGNVDPAAQFCNGTPGSIRAETLRVMERCCAYPNFVISSGCDIPPLSPWENIDAFFAAVESFNQQTYGVEA